MSRLRMLFQIPNQIISKTACASLILPRKFPTVENNLSSAIIHHFRQFSAKASEVKPEVESKELKKPLGKIEARLFVQFTCKKCETRSSKTMSKLAYEKGVVIIRCDGCKNNHLIADNLGWFSNDRRKFNLEKTMQLQGKKVRRLNAYGSDLFEVVEKDEVEMKCVDKE